MKTCCDSLITLTIVIGLATSGSMSLPAGGKTVRYDSYAVFKLNFENRAQLSLLDSATNSSYKVWKEYDDAEKDVHVMVGPGKVKYFKDLLSRNGINLELIIPDVQKLIDEEKKSGTNYLSGSFDWTRYHSYPEIEVWLDNILEANPNVTEGFVIGQSYEGRNIRGIKISYKKGNPGIFIESNIHAREWITSATATWFIDQLLSSQDEEVRELAENIDWYIIPVFNVDGFVYTHDQDRLWRKTRQPINDSECVGTDPNRNFDSYWMSPGGASSNPCEETFRGTAPFSEPETRALAEFVSSIKNKINIYLAFHSYGQLLLSPYGHSENEAPENYDDLLSIGAAFSTAVGNLTYGTKYVYGSTAKILYKATGASIDWVFNTQGVKVSYTIEFRDKGRYGFVLPPVQILPNCEELMAGLQALVKKSKQLNYL